MHGLEPQDILVTIHYPVSWDPGLQVTLAEWMEEGPHGGSHLIRPVEARSRLTGERLDLAEAVPPEYRNDAQSRRLIAQGEIAWPWPHLPQRRIVTDAEPEDLIVLIEHPFGDLRVTLAEWIERGPGPRFRIHPTAIWLKQTEEEISLESIPMMYRNDEESRQLIEDGQIPAPLWHVTRNS